MSDAFSIEQCMASGGVVIPELCKNHQRDLRQKRLRLIGYGPWKAAYTIGTMLMFKGIAETDRFRKRTQDRRENFNVVLAEIGCLACWDDEIYFRAIAVLRKGPLHAAAVFAGEKTDPDWEAPR